MPFKHERFEEIIRTLAAEFLSLESNRTSLITVTKVVTDKAESVATVYMTVFPDDHEETALDFAKRKRGEFRQYVKDHARLMRIPFFDFAIDKGEKSRQKIDRAMSGL